LLENSTIAPLEFLIPKGWEGESLGQMCKTTLLLCAFGDTISVAARCESTRFAVVRILGEVSNMPKVTITRSKFLSDRQGRTFLDVVDDAEQPFDEVLEFFNDADRQHRMEESETHHDRAPLAGVVRELESRPALHQFLATKHPRRSQRLRQAIGVLIRIIMELRGWKKTGRKGSLGIRSSNPSAKPKHNTGGLAFWFVRAERYELETGMPFPSVRSRCKEIESNGSKQNAAKSRPSDVPSSNRRKAAPKSERTR
jgi:hypothetical protein